ncbi:MAG: class II aldolase/adducin family protein [Verrucomicrobia bacterium]|nr:class II aldolase/adducin family protein [Verrucomicrobiota bacterium]
MAALSSPADTLRLLEFAHECGEKEFTILGEGNVSLRASEDTFLVKASGSTLEHLSELELTECRFGPLLEAIRKPSLSDEGVEQLLLESRVRPTALKPSVETFFHAYLLSLPGVRFVGHTHPIPINRILCTSHVRAFAERRQTPDEIVCCGTVSLLLPYLDPGLVLAQEIRVRLEAIRARSDPLPRVILLENHGIITFGPSVEAVRSAMLMAIKAAEVYLGAASLGEVRHLPEKEVQRIDGRLDEKHRQKMLRI